MSHFDGVTFAFSHSDKVWRTRYSFTPTAYASIDNTFISCNGAHPLAVELSSDQSDLVWEHDSNLTHNNFYGYQYETSVAFVSNYNPSSVKMYKSLSLESNSNSWTGFVTTNSNPLGSDQSEAQRGQLDSFVRKESSSYVDIPPSEINSTANLVSGFRAASPFGSGVTLDNFDQVTLLGAKFVWEVEIDHQHSQIPVGSFIVHKNNLTDSLCYLTITTTPIEIESTTPQGAGTNLAYISNFDAVSMTAEITIDLDSGIIAQINNNPLIAQAVIDNYISTWDFTQVYLDTGAKRNGDYMRGHYINVYLSNNSVDPVECFSFNVNYEPTHLDHSLGQNA
jgi:hypothetical protein|tara:strand:+ start:12585 stop:13595 length:1011 start_codon:yes stop_codon:yes gene_type:complete